ncbi:MAG: hypothetical protein KF901_16185 [Myxococcales bacterium]|nr:hypothetical protein [Myxococcales bacterium]
MTRTRTLRFTVGSALLCAPLTLAACGGGNEEVPDEPHVNVPPDPGSGGEVPEDGIDWAVTNPGPPDDPEPTVNPGPGDRPLPTANPAPPETP